MNSPGMWPLKGAHHQKQLKINVNKAYFPFSLLTWEFHQNRCKKGEESIIPNFPFILKKNSTKNRSNVNEAFFSISLQSNLEENDQSNNHIWKLTKVQEIQKYKRLFFTLKTGNIMKSSLIFSQSSCDFFPPSCSTADVLAVNLDGGAFA